MSTEDGLTIRAEQDAEDSVALPTPVRAYIAAYNARDVGAMAACVSRNIDFLDMSGEQVTVHTEGKDAFVDLATKALSYFSARTQTVTLAITVADITLANIDFAATVAMDLPNGWTEGQKIVVRGRSLFQLSGGQICRLIDES